MENQNESTGVEVYSNINQEIDIYNGASMLIVSKEESEKLLTPFDENIIEIRPDGLIYLPQTFWRQRLNQVFGIGQWAIIPKNTIKDPEKNKFYYEGVLLIRGAYIATSVGEAEYHQTNRGQSWASVYEASKSDCITRCCKDLGIASELWQPKFSRAWVAKYAIQVDVIDSYGNQKKQWRRIDQPALKGEVPPPQQQSAYNYEHILKDAIHRLTLCNTHEELSLLKSTLSNDIVLNKDFQAAGMKAYEAIKQATQ